MLQPRKKPHPPTSGQATGRATKFRQLPKSGRNLGHHLNRNLCLPPVGHSRGLPQSSPFTPEEQGTSSRKDSLPTDSDILEQKLSSPLSLGRPLDSAESANKFSRTLSSVKEDLLNQTDKTDTQSGNSATLNKERVESENSLKSNYSPKPVDIDTSLAAGTSSGSPFKNKITDMIPSEVPSKEELSFDSSNLARPAKIKDLTLETLCDSLRPPTSSKSKQKIKNGDLTIESLKEVLGRPQNTTRDITLESLHETFGRPTTSSRYKGIERRKEITLESLSTSEVSLFHFLIT